MEAIMYLFQNKTCLPEDVQLIYSKFKSLISSNILDTSLAEELLQYFHQLISIEENNKLLTLSKRRSTDLNNFSVLENSNVSISEDILSAFLLQVYNFLADNTSCLIKEFCLSKYYQIVNMFWFVVKFLDCINWDICYNLVFNKLSKIWKKLIRVDLKYNQNNLIILIALVFDLGGEIYNRIRDKTLKLKFESSRNEIIEEMKNTNSKGSHLDSFLKGKINEVHISLYTRLFKHLVNVDFTYERLLADESLTLEEKSIIKVNFTSSIIRIIFTKEKNKFVKNLFEEQDKSYELIFLENLVKKCLTFYYEKFGDNVNCLFRREEVPDDLIKYIFFTRGNLLFLNSIFREVNQVLTSLGSDEEIKFISVEEFKTLYNNILNYLQNNFPDSLKVVLKLIKIQIFNIYKIENHSGVLTILFFNFLLSPKLQDIYGINPIKNLLIKNLNKLIRNICFNEQFKEDDKLSYYNHLILDLHCKTKATIEKVIDSIAAEDDMDYLIRMEIQNSILEAQEATRLSNLNNNLNNNSNNNPNNTSFTNNIKLALFYRDCDNVIEIFEKAFNEEILPDLTDEVQYLESLMQLRKKTFLVDIHYQDFKRLKALDNMTIEDKK
jgi:hypothetical protein